MSFDTFIGIDPGKAGAFVALSKDRELILWANMGTLRETINFLETELGKVFVVIEKAQAMPKNGAVGMFNYGQGYGEIIGVLHALAISHHTVAPAKWSKVMHEGIPRAASPKFRSAQAADQLFPGLWPDLAKKYREGLVDALLLAEYGRRMHGVSTGI